jgi:hypothetical protein
MMKMNKQQIAYLEENYGKNILPLSVISNENWPGSNPIEILFFYRKETPIIKFKETLAKTIEYYNLFSSRLIMIGENKFALHYCTDGYVANILPPIDADFKDINIEDFKKMMKSVKTLPGEPLLAVTGVQLRDGILAGISCSEAVADGISMLLFMYAWMCIKEGKDFLPPSPLRLFKGHPVSSDKIDRVFIPSLSELSDKIQNRVKYGNVKTYTKIEYISDEFLSEIKNKTKSENEEYKISSNQIIVSFLLKKYHKMLLPDTERIRVRNPINLREVHPDVDSLYIGYAVLVSVTEFTKDEIDKMSIHQMAQRLNESITNARKENYVKEISYMSEYGIEFDPDIFKKHTPFNVNTDLSSTNLTHFGDLESMGVGPDIGSLLSVGLSIQTGFTLLKEKSGRIFAQITSRFPLT